MCLRGVFAYACDVCARACMRARVFTFARWRPARQAVKCVDSVVGARCSVAGITLEQVRGAAVGAPIARRAHRRCASRAQVKSMDYIDWSVKEAMRIISVVPVVRRDGRPRRMWRLTGGSGAQLTREVVAADELCGVRIPAGVRRAARCVLAARGSHARACRSQ